MVEQSAVSNSKVEVLSKLAATVVLLVYAIGFLITSLYCMDFGFSAANPFRPRVASAGVWFGILVGMPMFVGRLGLRHHIARRMEAKPWQQWSVLAFSLYVMSYSASFLLASAFDIREPLRKSVVPFAVAVATIFLAGPIYKWWKKRTASVVVLLVTLVILIELHLVRALMLGHGFTVDALVLWFFAVALASITDLYDFPSNVGWHTDWYAIGGLMLLLITIFAAAIYPSIKASWGGGQTLPVTLYLSRNAAVMPGQTWRVQLIEEADNGYYVLAKGEKKALFIPRSAVELVYFSDAQPTFNKQP